MIEQIISDEKIEYIKDGWQHHKPNGPAIIWKDGCWEWYLYGYRHRYYGPAVHYVAEPLLDSDPEQSFYEYWIFSKKIK